MKTTSTMMAVLMSLCVCSMAFGGSLVARYEFEGNANDSTGIHNGTAYGDAGYVTDANRGQVLSLDGAGDYVAVSDHTAFTLSDITVGAWVKGAPQYLKTVASQWNSSGNRAWILNAGSTVVDDTSTAVVSGDGQYANSSELKDYRSSIVSFDETWHHIAFTFDGDAAASTLKLYVDGLEDTSVNIIYDDNITSIFDSTSNIGIGCDYSSGSPYRFFNGMIDDVQIYDYALPASEIQDVMAGNVVPEPMTLLLLGLGAVMIRKNR